MFALILSGPNSKTAPVGIMNFIGFEEVAWGPLMAATIVMLVPIVIFAILVQRGARARPDLRRGQGITDGRHDFSYSQPHQHSGGRFMTLLLGVDIGTTGLKSALLDGDGTVLAEASREYPTCHPAPGWAEQDPELWWDALRATVTEVVTAAGAAGSAWTASRSAAWPLWSRPWMPAAGPLLPGLIWADKRAEAESAWLRAVIGEETINRITANHINAYFVAPKCLWLKRHRPDVFAQTHQIVMANGYLNFRLTGRLAMDHSHVPLLLLADAQTLDWSAELLDAMELDRAIFPPIRACLDIVRRTDSCGRGRARRGPRHAGAGRHRRYRAGSSAWALARGQAFVSMGTGSNVGTCLAGPAFNQPLVCVPHAIPGLWLALGVMTSTGASLKWFKNELCSDVQAQAAAEAATSTTCSPPRQAA